MNTSAPNDTNTTDTYSNNYSPEDWLIEDGVLLSYIGTQSEVDIPYGVTSIGKGAFEDCNNLISINIPDTVTSIGDLAFYKCSNLQSVTIPDHVTSIGFMTFERCSSLISVTLPDSVTSIDARAFYRCNKLTSINIPDSVKSIGNNAFFGCSNLSSIIIPDNVAFIGDRAFKDCRRLTSVTIPNSVTTIGDSAFDPGIIINFAKDSYAEQWYKKHNGINQNTDITSSIPAMEEWAQQGRTSIYNGEYAKALEYLKPSAEAGVANGQYLLGYMYYFGLGVSQSDKKAAEWYQKAADQDFIFAEYQLAGMYKNGEGVTQSNEKAAEWYRVVADHDRLTEYYVWFRNIGDQVIAEAQYNLGNMYSNGEGVTQSDEKAVEWYQKAAEFGKAESQNNLGLMYCKGLGVTQSYEKCAEWFKKAADQELQIAQYNLGLLYLNGGGVTKSDDKALELFLKAARSWETHKGVSVEEEIGAIYQGIHYNAWSLFRTTYQGYEPAIEKIATYRIKINTDTLIKTAPNNLADVNRSIMKGDIAYSTGKSSGSWIYIHTEDGSTGWIPESTAEKITN